MVPETNALPLTEQSDLQWLSSLETEQSKSTKWLHFPQASVYNPRFNFPHKEGVLKLRVSIKISSWKS